MQLHHIGCLVENIETGIEEYQLLHEQAEASKIYDIQSQEVRVCFVKLSSDDPTFIELVQPLNETSFLHKLMVKKKVNFYHLGFFTPDIDAKTEELVEKGYHLINTFQSEAFDGRKCVFLYSPSLHLIELIEAVQ